MNKSNYMKRKHKPNYDQRCYDLAAIFLGDEPSLHTPARIEELAACIQQTIEDYITIGLKEA